MYKVERGNAPVAKFFKKLNELSLHSTTLSLPVITIFGNETFLIEEFVQLKYFSNHKISFDYEHGFVEILGKNLWIDMLYPRELVIKGQINAINFNADREGDK